MCSTILPTLNSIRAGCQNYLTLQNNSWCVIAFKVATYATVLIPAAAFATIQFINCVSPQKSSRVITYQPSPQEPPPLKALSPEPAPLSVNVNRPVERRPVVSQSEPPSQRSEANRPPIVPNPAPTPTPSPLPRIPSPYELAQQRLEEGINVSENAMQALNRLMPDILTRNRGTSEITWHKSRSGNYIFRLDSAPGLIFKMGRSVADTRNYFANQVMMEKICHEKGLTLLRIPHAKMIGVSMPGEEIQLIAQEFLPIQPEESRQEELYKLNNLDPAIGQLVVFTINSGYSRISWRKNPVLDDAPDFRGSRRIALIDLWEMTERGGSTAGIYGSPSTLPGSSLVGCLSSETQIDGVIALAFHLGCIEPGRFDAPTAKQRRMAQIQSDQQLVAFHASKGILDHPRQPIQVKDLNSLGLDLDETDSITESERRVIARGNESDSDDEIKENKEEKKEEKFPIKLGDVLTDVIEDINKAIQKTPEEASVKGKRSIELDIRPGSKLSIYADLGISKEMFKISPEDEKKLWLTRILNALEKSQNIFKVLLKNNKMIRLQL